MSDATKSFADKLQDLISEDGGTIRELVAATKVSSLSKYQNDAAEAGINSLVKIARYFNVSTDWLLGLSDCKSISGNAKTASMFTGLSTESVRALQNIKNSRDDREHDDSDTFHFVPQTSLDGTLLHTVTIETVDDLIKSFEFYEFLYQLQQAYKLCCFRIREINDLHHQLEELKESRSDPFESKYFEWDALSVEDELKYAAFRISDVVQRMAGKICRLDEAKSYMRDIDKYFNKYIEESAQWRSEDGIHKTKNK